jgi:hypothetical protein
MQIDGSALDDRLQKVAFQELDSDDEREREEGEIPAPVRERDEDRDEAGDERAHVRDERAEEDEHGKGEGERDAEDPQPDPDQRRVDRRDHRRSLDEAAEDAPRSPSRPVDDGPGRRVEPPQNPAPEGSPVAQDEVEQRDREHEAGDQSDSGL